MTTRDNSSSSSSSCADLEARAEQWLAGTLPGGYDPVEMVRDLVSALREMRVERDNAQASSREKVHRAFKAKNAPDGTCKCPYCTGNVEELSEMVANYELDTHDAIQRAEAAEREVAAERQGHQTILDEAQRQYRELQRDLSALRDERDRLIEQIHKADMNAEHYLTHICNITEARIESIFATLARVEQEWRNRLHTIDGKPLHDIEGHAQRCEHCRMALLVLKDLASLRKEP